MNSHFYLKYFQNIINWIIKQEILLVIVDDDDLNQLNATHPIENKSEIKHKSDRIILDNLLDIVSDQ